MQINKKINEINDVICKNIDKLHKEERGLLSQNILSQLRNFIEVICLKIYAAPIDVDPNNYDHLQDAINYIKSRGDLKFLRKLHLYLQNSTSHYTFNEENSERLMLKYYEFLLKTKKFLKKTYSIDVLFNMHKFLNNIDQNLKEYYKKISEKILENKFDKLDNDFSKSYYIEKIKPFFLNNEIFYEITFSEARNWTSKFDRIIAFTNLEIQKNYSVKLSFCNSNINIDGKIMPILIINKWEVSIRPCEINNFAAILGKKIQISRNHKEYCKIMNFLTKTSLNLLDIIEFEEKKYTEQKNKILININKIEIFEIFDICHKLIKENYSGANIIRYLLYQMNNKIIKKQRSKESCEKLSNLFLDWKCIPFDNMPFSFSLIKHNPSISNLLECINPNNRKHELLARFIKNNTENKGKIYTPISEILGFLEPIKLIDVYNRNLYYKHSNRKINNFKNHLYINEYENNTYNILQKLKEYSSNGIKSYTDSVISWFDSNNSPKIDSEQKKEILKQLFENSKVALIYGPAGTGKSTLINYISIFFNNFKKLYLANTNPAVENLKQKVTISDSNCEFMTIFKFLTNKKYSETKYDLIVIDECSCVNNKDMYDILNKAQFEFLILVGDIYQIEAIIFGNWFNLSKKFLPKKIIFELSDQYRTNNKQLLELWNKVRNYDELTIEHIVKNNYSKTLDNSIFNKENDDEIILCLNYDGLYGINNLNKFLQKNNPNPAIEWGIKTYKINDPILFNESNRFSPVIFNNLKGKILKIEIIGDKIQFNIEIDKMINEFEANSVGLTLIGKSLNNKSIIQFLVNKYRDTPDEDDDDQIDNIVPFQISYAISIHKAQGLEYNSVKIVITDEIDELITHNIFYTAITRTKEKLKIYWTPETQNKVISNFSKKDDNKDYYLLLEKHKQND